jgi:hypothetical protein
MYVDMAYRQYSLRRPHRCIYELLCKTSTSFGEWLIEQPYAALES